MEIVKGSIRRKSDRSRGQPRLFFTQTTLVMNRATGTTLGLDPSKQYWVKLDVIEESHQSPLTITFRSDGLTIDDKKKLHEVKRGQKNGMYYLSLYDYLMNDKLFPQAPDGERVNAEVVDMVFETDKMELIIKRRR